MMRDINSKILNHLPPLDYIESYFAEYSLELETIKLVYGITESYAANEKIESHIIDDIFAVCDGIKDHLWEIINTGHYSEVEQRIRQLYTIFVLQKVILLAIQAEYNGMQLNDLRKTSIWELDNGILIGCPLAHENYRYCLNDCLDTIQMLSTENDKDTRTTYQIDQPDMDNVMKSTRKCDIAMCDRPSIEHFQSTYFDQAPVILQNCMDQWPALNKWNQSNYLLNICKHRIVPIEIGQNYSTENWSQQLMRFEEFFRRQMIDDGTSELASSSQNNIEYLAQHNLFEQIPQLKKDIIIPEYCCITNGDGNNGQQYDEVDIKAWLGPQGTISPMHYDNKQNLLCQVFGSKRIILAHRDDTPYLYPHDGEMLRNTSQIDAESLDLQQFPLTENVKFYELTLCKGEMLYIPSKWWHYVRSLSKSFSVSFWWE